MKIILISGKAQHGKDTFSYFLKEELTKNNSSCLIMHFGDALKYIAKEYFNWDGIKDAEGRTLLQTIGTEIVRAKDEHFWTDFIGRLARVLNYDYILIPDWRFEEEHSRLAEYCEDIITIRINRYEKFDSFEDCVPYVNATMTEEQLNHRSETELDNYPCEYIIANTTLVELASSAIEFVKVLTTL